MEDRPSGDDGFKWFGEGFDGFPKRLPEDCVEYVIYAVDEKLTTTAATCARLNEILRASKESSKKLLKDYLWQRDAFELKLRRDGHGDGSGPPHLRGRTNFGDSVADEWLVVYLLLELSRQCPDAWIRAYDTDGEFLLIEAANALPKWLNPDIAENRVWISNGHLRIIPPNESASSKNLPVQGALSFIRATPERLIISPFIEDEAFYRLREYPSAISSSLHHALTIIPRRLAYLLHSNPAYISPAIDAFYLRDAVSLKPIATKDISTLHFPPDDFVPVSVKFTKVGYAQLRSQAFDPPSAWTAVIPCMKDPAAEMGMKLTCGFEMLVSDPQNKDKRAVREVKLLLEDVRSGENALPTESELATWSQRQDDEKWLDIDYNDFENELSGNKNGKSDEMTSDFGNESAQNNLRKMVSRFKDFLDDDETSAQGIDDSSSADSDNDDVSSESEDKDGSFDEVEFERAMKEMMGMPADEVEKSGLLDEARQLAVQDAEEGSEIDEDEEMRKVMEMMEEELKGHGALELNSKTPKGASKPKPVFGPARPPAMVDATVAKANGKATPEDTDEDIGPGDGELSSDDEDFNDVDLGLAKNMLEAFKGQAGMAGPAGNLMRSLGVNLPRDEDSE